MSFVPPRLGIWIVLFNFLLFVRAQRAGLARQTVCSVEQDRTDLDCPCRFRELPCRVPGSVCDTGFIPGGLDTELRCRCSGFFQRGVNQDCVEKPAVIIGVPPPPPTIQEVGVPNNQIEGPNDYDFVPVNRAQNGGIGGGAPKFRPNSGPKRPSKAKAPFKTVMITSEPLHANQPSRKPQVNPFQRPNFQNGMGIGVESPSIDTILTNARPKDRWTRPPFAKGMNVGGSKSTAAGGKGTHVNKRPVSRMPKRTTRTIPRADGSRVVNGWYPDIWPAVGLNYSI